MLHCSAVLARTLAMQGSLWVFNSLVGMQISPTTATTEQWVHWPLTGIILMHWEGTWLCGSLLTVRNITTHSSKAVIHVRPSALREAIKQVIVSKMLMKLCRYSLMGWNYNSHCTSVFIYVFLMWSESYARKHAVVWFNLQQQVVHRHIHHSVPQQERLVRRENSNLSADDMLPWVQRYLIWIVAAGWTV